MRKIGIIAVVILLCVVVGFAVIRGLSAASSPQDAIQKSKRISTIEKKTDYLMVQAQNFFNKKDFKSAIDVAQYILRKVDANSQEAKTLVRKAQDALAVQLEIQARAKTAETK